MKRTGIIGNRLPLAAWLLVIAALALVVFGLRSIGQCAETATNGQEQTMQKVEPSKAVGGVLVIILTAPSGN